MTNEMSIILNPDDGTSRWRARVLTGEGETLRCLAIFTTLEGATLFADGARLARVNAELLQALEEMIGESNIRVPNGDRVCLLCRRHSDPDDQEPESHVLDCPVIYARAAIAHAHEGAP